MKRTIAISLFSLIIAFSLCSCGIAYMAKSNEMLKSASISDFGPPPPANYQQIATQFIRSRLLDPDSAKIQVGSAVRGTIQRGFGSPTPILVWVTSAAVNAKNTFGGYTGTQSWALAWQHGRIVVVSSPRQNMYGEEIPGHWEYLQ